MGGNCRYGHLNILFVCQNIGFPIFPPKKTSLLAKGWLHRPVTVTSMELSRILWWTTNPPPPRQVEQLFVFVFCVFLSIIWFFGPTEIVDTVITKNACYVRKTRCVNMFSQQSGFGLRCGLHSPGSRPEKMDPLPSADLSILPSVFVLTCVIARSCDFSRAKWVQAIPSQREPITPLPQASHRVWTGITVSSHC